MRSNKELTNREEQDLAIELWQESKISQVAFCKQEGIVYNTFRGWMKRYRKTKGLSGKVTTESHNGFLDVEIDQISTTLAVDHQNETITIRYPNGVELSCNLPLALSQNLLTLLD
jgi:transposase-like protein